MAMPSILERINKRRHEESFERARRGLTDEPVAILLNPNTYMELKQESLSFIYMDFGDYAKPTTLFGYPIRSTNMPDDFLFIWRAV